MRNLHHAWKCTVINGRINQDGAIVQIHKHYTVLLLIMGGHVRELSCAMKVRLFMLKKEYLRLHNAQFIKIVRV
jgi:hypothetical protein